MNYIPYGFPVAERLDSTLRPLGLTSATFELLSEMVSATHPLELQELATRLRTPPSGLGPLLDGLERDGFVRRAPQPAPGRSVRVVITARGRARHGAGAELVSVVRRQLAEAMARVDAAAVERALSALR